MMIQFWTPRVTVHNRIISWNVSTVKKKTFLAKIRILKHCSLHIIVDFNNSMHGKLSCSNWNNSKSQLSSCVPKFFRLSLEYRYCTRFKDSTSLRLFRNARKVRFHLCKWQQKGFVPSFIIFLNKMMKYTLTDTGV